MAQCTFFPFSHNHPVFCLWKFGSRDPSNPHQQTNYHFSVKNQLPSSLFLAMPLWSWIYFSIEHTHSLYAEVHQPPLGASPPPNHLSAWVHWRRVIVLASSLHLSPQPETPHQEKTPRGGWLWAPRGFCLRVFPQKLSPNRPDTWGKEVFSPFTPFFHSFSHSLHGWFSAALQEDQCTAHPHC